MVQMQEQSKPERPLKTYAEYLKEYKINGKGQNTLIYYESILKEANRYKPFAEWDKGTVTDFILSLQDKYKKGTIEAKKAVIKKFFQWAGKPEIVQHLKVKFPKTSLKRDDILTIQDINLMIETTKSPMYKALISFLFESGGRINEVLPVLVDDVKEEDKGMIIRIHATKTGDEYRSILCVFSAQYIRNHITYSGLTKGNLLFPVKRPAVHVMLNKIGTKAGIEMKTFADGDSVFVAADDFKNLHESEVVFGSCHDFCVAAAVAMVCVNGGYVKWH